MPNYKMKKLRRKQRRTRKLLYLRRRLSHSSDLAERERIIEKIRRISPHAPISYYLASKWYPHYLVKECLPDVLVTSIDNLFLLSKLDFHYLRRTIYQCPIKMSLSPCWEEGVALVFIHWPSYAPNQQPMQVRHHADHLTLLIFGENGRQSHGHLGSRCIDWTVQVFVKHHLVKKQQRAKGLILGRSRHAFLDNEMRQKHLHFRGSHIAWVTLFMKNVSTPGQENAWVSRHLRWCFSTYVLLHLILESTTQ